MIVSASYKTDIPAFYGEWFINRLNAGYCMVRNSYGGKPFRVGLRREDVDGFVFWTKNVGSFMDKLAALRERGYRTAGSLCRPRRLAGLAIRPNRHYVGNARGLDMQRDRAVNRSLRKMGWRVVRVWESAVIADPDSVAKRILVVAKKRD